MDNTKKAFRVTNVTNIATGTRGFFLDLGSDKGVTGKHIPVGKQIVLEAASYDTLPSCITEWAAKGYVRVVDLSGGAVVGGPAADGELTPSAINPVREMNGGDDFEDEPDLSSAHEARLTNENFAPINQSTSGHANAKVTDAMAEERGGLDLSPIPGDRPVDVDDTKGFTVRAGRSNQPGAIVGSRK